MTSTGASRLTSLLRTSSTCSLEVVFPPVSEHLCTYRLKHIDVMVTDMFTSFIISYLNLISVLSIYVDFYSGILVMLKINVRPIDFCFLIGITLFFPLIPKITPQA